MIAVKLNNIELVNILLENGASIFNKDNKGKTVFDYITKETDKQISAKLYDIKKNGIDYSPTVQKRLKRLNMAPKDPQQFQNEQSACCRI